MAVASFPNAVKLSPDASAAPGVRSPASQTRPLPPVTAHPVGVHPPRRVNRAKRAKKSAPSTVLMSSRPPQKPGKPGSQRIRRIAMKIVHAGLTRWGKRHKVSHPRPRGEPNGRRRCLETGCETLNNTRFGEHAVARLVSERLATSFQSPATGRRVGRLGCSGRCSLAFE